MDAKLNKKIKNFKQRIVSFYRTIPLPRFTISKSTVGSYAYYCKVTDSQGWNTTTNIVLLNVITNPTPPPSSEFNLPLEYVGGIAAIIGVIVLIFLLRKK